MADLLKLDRRTFLVRTEEIKEPNAGKKLKIKNFINS